MGRRLSFGCNCIRFVYGFFRFAYCLLSFSACSGNACRAKTMTCLRFLPCLLLPDLHSSCCPLCSRHSLPSHSQLKISTAFSLQSLVIPLQHTLYFVGHHRGFLCCADVQMLGTNNVCETSEPASPEICRICSFASRSICCAIVLSSWRFASSCSGRRANPYENAGSRCPMAICPRHFLLG